jgi:crossover junction endodeoxyribonuclease RuvC
MTSHLPIKPGTHANAVRFCVLGVDPSSAGATGYGVVEFVGAAPRMLRYGALKMRMRTEFGARLREIHELITALVTEFSPDAVAVESVFTALNVGTTLRLAEVRGVVLLAAAQNNVMVHSYSPREVKASVAGYGNADKRQMQVMVRALLKMTETPEPADAADALAVALCHLQAEQTRARFALPDTKVGPAAVRRREQLATARAAGNSVRAGRATPFDSPRIVTQR